MTVLSIRAGIRFVSSSRNGVGKVHTLAVSPPEKSSRMACSVFRSRWSFLFLLLSDLLRRESLVASFRAVVSNASDGMVREEKYEVYAKKSSVQMMRKDAPSVTGKRFS